MKRIQEKVHLRRELLHLRRNAGKEIRRQWNEGIYRQVMQHPWVQSANLIFIYVSSPEEVDTMRLIADCLAQGKRVAVPRCLDSQGHMRFYEIHNPDTDLEPGMFGLLEPVPSRCEQAQAGAQAVCLVPGLSFDRMGYRIGYGRGYYDRFLSGFKGKACGLCPAEFLLDALPVEETDRRVAGVITENGFLQT